ncbi:MAG: NPCBM/NEW2 domain-containing protein [Fimbriimonadaceae bacterium]|nr:NPCBM/NEW2 domain-containing protein [Fimbriimonadaceae bacterium]
MKAALVHIIAYLALLAPVFAQTTHREWWDQAARPTTVLPAVSWAGPAPQLDGDLIDWIDLPGLPLGLVHQAGFDKDWRGRADLSATIRFARTADGLLLAVDVADDRLVVAPGNDRTRGDQVRLFLGPTPAESRALALLPAWQRDGSSSAAAVVDLDQRDLLRGAPVSWRQLEKGYRAELRLPWAALQPLGRDLSGARLAVQVIDWDDPNGEKVVLSWPADLQPPATQPPARPKTSPWEPPVVATVARPERFGELRAVERFELETAAEFLPSIVQLGTEASFYGGGEDARVLALCGLPPEQVVGLDAYVVDPAGQPALLSRGDFWTDGAVRGLQWTWAVPYDFSATHLLAAWIDRPALAQTRLFGRLESIGAAYREHLARLDALQREMLAAAVAPGSDARRRRYLGSVLINLEDKAQSQSAWASYLARDDLAKLEADFNDLRSQFAAALDGRDPYAGRKGTLLRGYVSDIDDTLQHYSVSVPDSWNPTARLPLVVSIHGYGFGRFLGHPAPAYPDAVAVACFGRGNGDYKLWCERDILTVMDAMLEDYGVDPNRVYITGGSMGGTGSFHMASLFPDRFAAIGPTAANANHHVWEEVWGWGQRERTPLSPFRDWIESTTSAFQYAENYRNVGVYCLHGTLDNICPVGHARTITERLANLGYDVVYEEFPDVGHGGFSAAAGNRQKNYMFSRARDPYPRQVTWKTSWPRYDGTAWLRLERFAQVARDALLDARIDGQQIRITTDNVARLRLELNDQLVSADRPLQVLVDGQPAWEGALPRDGVVRLGRVGEQWQAVEAPRTLEKNVAVGGPLEHAFMSRFLLVCGTTGDRRTNEVNRRMTEQLAEKWRRWGREQRARVKLDRDVTAQDIADSNLVCFGGPDSNSVVAQINDRLPVRFEGDAVVAGAQRFRGRDVGLKLCYPNPLNPQRYVCVLAGVTWEGTYDINGRFGNFFDWGVFDDRNYFDFLIFDAQTSQEPETAVLFGYFDPDWSLREAVTFRGDPAIREAVRPRHPPDPLAPLPTADEVYVSSLTPLAVRQEKGVIGYDQSFTGRPITLGSQRFERGLGVHPQAEIVYDLERGFQSFEAWVGVDLEGASTVSKAREEAERVAFQVYGDGRLLADTGEMRWNTPARHMVVNVADVKELTLTARALDGRKWLFGDAGWGLARLSRRAEVRVAPPPLRLGADRLGLDGEWLLDDDEIGEGVARGAQATAPAAQDRRVTLPGTIQAALQAAGELPDPYRNDQLTAAAEVARREWWVYRRVDLPAAWSGRRLWLHLSGVSQQADVWLNGTWLGEAAGPHARVELEATGPARYGERNLLALRLLAGPAAWTNVRNPAAPAREVVLGLGSSYGRDAGGTCLPIGVTGDLELRASGPVRLAPLRVATQLPEVNAVGPLARVAGMVVVSSSLRNLDKTPRLVTVRGQVAALDGLDPAVPFERRLRLAALETVPLQIAISMPRLRLWWPAGRGGQPAWRVTAEVRTEDQVSDAGDARFAPRRIELPAAPGPASLLVNGQPVLLRIAEWTTADRLLRPSRARCEQILRLALETGFNAVRIPALSGLAEADCYELCDELGLLVLQDLPLEGEVGRATAATVAGAVDSVLLATLNRPSVVAYVVGNDLGLSAATAERRALAEDRLAELAPDRLSVAPTSSGAGLAQWIFREPQPDASGARRALPLNLTRLELPGAPPADLSFLDRQALPLDDALTPWPLTAWWRLHGGSDTDLLAAQRWLGAARDEAELLALLTRWQVEQTRRQAAAAVANGGAVCVANLNESWPRCGPALVAYDGSPRAARDVLRRYLTGPALVALASDPAPRPGHSVRVELHARGADDPAGWAARPSTWQQVTCRIESLDGQVWAEQTWDLPAGADPALPAAVLTWEVPLDAPAGAYLAIATVPGAAVEAEVLTLAVQARPQHRVRVLWLSDESPWPGIQPVGREELASGTWEVACLGPGHLPPLLEVEAQALLAAVRGGAGLLVIGPPTWLGPGAATDLLAARPLLTPPADPVPGQPELRVTTHPALASLGNGLPAGVLGDWYELPPTAEVLAQWGRGRPLLVESAAGRGRVLEILADRDYLRRLGVWDQRERFLSGLLAYAGKLSHADTQSLLAVPTAPPLASLRDLPAGTLKLTVDTAPLTLTADRPETRLVRLKNESATPMPLVQLRVSGLPLGVSGTFSQGALVLLPGEEKAALLTLRTVRRGRRTATVQLAASGWGVRATSVDLPLEAR